MVTLLKVLNNHDDIYKYQRQFEAELSQASTKAAVKQISFRPQIRTRNIRWNLGLGIWWYLSGDNSDKVDENRWWNVFGVDDLDSTRSLRITCEINFPDNKNIKVDRRIGGVFLEQYGDIYIGHRGNVGGGKEGIGKSQFLDYFRGNLVYAEDDGRETPVLLVARLGKDSSLACDLSNFVHKVREFKDKSGLEERLPESNPTFQPEFEGLRAPAYSTQELRAQVHHGWIVRMLRERLSQLGIQAGNDRERDLYVSRHKLITAQFEVKTLPSTSNIYSAIGQLKYHSEGPGVSPTCKNYAVFPVEVNSETVCRFEALGIQVIKFEYDGDQVVFPNIESVVLPQS